MSTGAEARPLHRPGPRTVVVTGAARGIGQAIAEAFAAAGCRVVLADVDAANGAAAAAALRGKGAQAMFVRADMSVPADVDALMSEAVAAFGGLDVLVNNAAVTRVIDFFDVTVADWDTIFTINSRGYFLALQAAARHMREQGGGSIVNIASIAGKGWRETTNIAYAASKGAVLAMTRIAAATLGRYGIRVNAICPGMTRTDMMAGWIRDRAVAAGVSEADATGRFTSGVALGRLNTPADIAATAVFLASDAASGITGQSVNVDGGVVWD